MKSCFTAFSVDHCALVHILSTAQFGIVVEFIHLIMLMTQYLSVFWLIENTTVRCTILSLN